ncbi:MAG: hypothetical protein M1837_004182 [Sclerophora amabilis]|nr:MAG: hypothetical protein M1837_004182 [Sclerophora amabilis]
MSSPVPRGSHSVSEVGQNAISTLLQPPIVRTGLLPHTSATAAGAYRPPSSRDIPPVTLTNLPHIEPSAFRPYLLQADSLYEAFQRAKEDGGGGRSRLFRRGKDNQQNEELSLISENAVRGPRRTQFEATRHEASFFSGASPSDPPQSERRRSSAANKRTPVLSPLSTIPSVYFEDDFHLENPRTFDVVSERSDVVRPVPGTLRLGTGIDDSTTVSPRGSERKALATNAILQEKLSWYMDTVEVHLISSISTASTSFFAALGSLRELHSEAFQSVERIRNLRDDLGNLDKEMAIDGLKVVSMRRRRDNLRRLGDAVSQLKSIVDGVAKCEELVKQGDIELALDDLEELERLIAGEGRIVTSKGSRVPVGNDEGGHIELTGLNGLQGVSTDLGALRLRIGQAFEAQFLDILLKDARTHVDTVTSHETLQRWITSLQRSKGERIRKPSAFPAYLNLDSQLRSNLLSILHGLSRSHHTLQATASYREAMLRFIKGLIRQYLPSSSEDDAESMASSSTRGGRQLSQQEKSSILARNLRDLPGEDAEGLLRQIYASIGEAIRRLSVQVKLLLDVTSGIGSPSVSAGLKSPPRSPNVATLDGYMNLNASQVVSSTRQDQTEALDLSSLIGQAVDIAQAQIVKVLKVRAERTTHLPLPLFLRYFTLNRLFADECEVVSGRPGTALKSVVNGHIKDFVGQFGDSERQSLAQSMDLDKWEAKDFGEAQSVILGVISDGSTRDVGAWDTGASICRVNDSQRVPEQREKDVYMNGNAVDGTKEKVRSATIDEQKFILPSSALEVLGGVEKFEHLICEIPSMTQEVTFSLLEYLKLFNSRSCQLILGAGATRSAGLKNITTKHLALASQALSFIVALIPYIREFIRRHSSSNGTLMVEFDKVRRLYQEHQSGIHDKLVDIMSGRSTSHVKNMQKIVWDTSSSADQAVNTYMADLVKETSTLHRVLSKHLPDATVKAVMVPIFESYKEQWGKAFGEAPVRSLEGKTRMLRDAGFMKTKLGKLDESSDIGDFILSIVQSKSIENESNEAAPPKDINGRDASSASPSAAEMPGHSSPRQSNEGVEA